MNSINLTAQALAVFEAHGKTHGAGRNSIDGIKAVCRLWIGAGKPALPTPQKGAFASYTRRFDDATLVTLREAGNGNASQGARMLAEWMREQDEHMPTSLLDATTRLLAAVDFTPPPHSDVRVRDLITAARALENMRRIVEEERARMAGGAKINRAVPLDNYPRDMV